MQTSEAGLSPEEYGTRIRIDHLDKVVHYRYVNSPSLLTREPLWASAVSKETWSP